MPRLVVTRPQPEADAWVARLQQAGVDAVALPLLEIHPISAPAPQAALQAALAQLPQYRAAMFVSGNAVRFWGHALHAQGHALPLTLRYWAPGPGTAQALASLGIAADQIDQPPADAAQFDSEALWPVVASSIRPGDRILLVRGSDPEHAHSASGQGRAWLLAQLTAAGVQVDTVAVYERRPPAFSPPWTLPLRALHAARAWWLFSSSECLQHLVQGAPDLGWQHATALATHPRIAAQARRNGFGCVIDTHPTVQAIVASLESAHEL